MSKQKPQPKKWHKTPRAGSYARFVGISAEITRLESKQSEADRCFSEAKDRERYHAIRCLSLLDTEAVNI